MQEGNGGTVISNPVICPPGPKDSTGCPWLLFVPWASVMASLRTWKLTLCPDIQTLIPLSAPSWFGENRWKYTFSQHHQTITLTITLFRVLLLFLEIPVWLSLFSQAPMGKEIPTYTRDPHISSHLGSLNASPSADLMSSLLLGQAWPTPHPVYTDYCFPASLILALYTHVRIIFGKFQFSKLETS